MNQRIEELKHRATIWCDENIPDQFSEETGGYGQTWEDKFAQLLVQECVETLKTKSETYGAYLIEKHFGVEP